MNENLHLFESFNSFAARGLARFCALAFPGMQIMKKAIWNKKTARNTHLSLPSFLERPLSVRALSSSRVRG